MTAVLAIAVGLSAAGSVAVAQAPTAPINDDYLNSLNLNQPGSALDSVNTLVDRRDLTAATVQPNILAPKPGPAEMTGCGPDAEGHTIWYDFYPNANGLVQVATSAAFSTVIAVMPYDPNTLLPINSQRKCIVNATNNSHSLFVNVTAGKDYTIQLGGEDNSAGPVELQFNYLLPPLSANATLAAQPTSSGVKVVSLNVSAPKKSSVTVQCTRGCHTQSARGSGGTVSIRGLKGAALPAGALLKIYVTAPNRIGAYIAYKITRGNLSKLPQQCVSPGSKKVVSCP
jgi:hypothetical protein